MSNSCHKWCVVRRRMNHLVGKHQETVFSRHKTEQAAKDQKPVARWGENFYVRRLQKGE